MYYLVVGIYVIVCFLLLVVVLLQQGKGGDIAAAFGGSSSQTAFGARAGATVLTRATAILGTLFMLGALSLALMSRSGGGGSVLSVNGALIGFTGVGGNTVSVANGLCPCTTIGGLPVSLTGGAVAANVSIQGAIKNGNLGTLSVAPNAAVIRVDGAATKVTINGM